MVAMKESEVKKAVTEYFRKRGYFVPKAEFDIGVRPDVSAFRWRGPYEIENIAVECKPFKSLRSLIETCLGQAREYQLAFQHVYLSTPKRGSSSLNTIMDVLAQLRMGLLSVDEKRGVSLELEPRISPRLVNAEFLSKVRQRAVALLTYRDSVEPDFDLNFADSEIVYCFKKGEPANFLLSNAYLGRDYFFGICIEQIRIVKATLGGIGHGIFHKMLSDLPRDYSIDLEYIDTYKPREVSWSALTKAVKDVTLEDARWMLEYCRQASWKIRLLIMRKVWDKDEILSRSEHRERVEEVKSSLLPMRRKLVE